MFGIVTTTYADFWVSLYFAVFQCCLLLNSPSASAHPLPLFGRVPIATLLVSIAVGRWSGLALTLVVWFPLVWASQVDVTL